MREHRLPSDGTLVVLSGRVQFLSDAQDVREELSAGAMAVFAPELCHAVEAIEDSTFLVIIGGRERPEVSPSHGEPLTVPGS